MGLGAAPLVEPGQSDGHYLFPCPWNVHTAYHSCSGSCSKNKAFKELGVVETIWTEYVTELSYGLHITLRLVDRCGDLLILWLLKQNLIG